MCMKHFTDMHDVRQKMPYLFWKIDILNQILASICLKTLHRTEKWLCHKIHWFVFLSLFLFFYLFIFQRLICSKHIFKFFHSSHKIADYRIFIMQNCVTRKAFFHCRIVCFMSQHEDQAIKFAPEMSFIKIVNQSGFVNQVSIALLCLLLKPYQ